MLSKHIMQYKADSVTIGMEITYRFESSDEINKFKCSTKHIDMDSLVDKLLKNIFKGETPSCYLEAVNVTTDKIDLQTPMPIVFKRTYKQRFNKKKKPVRIESPVDKQPISCVIRKRRWRSRSPKKRRWRSRSPSKRYKERW